MGMAVVTVDFDGTLFKGSSFKVMWRVATKEFTRKQWAVVSSAMIKAAFLGAVIGKNAFRMQFFRAGAKGFRGESQQKLDGFFQRQVNIGKREVNHDLVKKIREHQQNGDAVIVLSGALKPFLEVFIKKVSLDVHIISTELLFDEHDICTDVSTIINGQEKVKKVQAWIADAMKNEEITAAEANEIWAYADSKSDIPLFEFADFPIVVNPKGTMKEIAVKNDWPVLL